MNALQPATPMLPPVREFLRTCMDAGLTRADAKRQYRGMRAAKWWKNDVYTVQVYENISNGFGVPVTHLSIKRTDRQPVHDWRDLQQIKNQICGSEREGVELYPAESRKVDTANQYHLWVFPEGLRVPCGYQEREVTDNPGCGAVQRPGSAA